MRNQDDTEELYGWTFRYQRGYWVALPLDKMKGLPLDAANAFYETHGKEARAGGDCACRPPETWVERFTPSGQSIAVDPSGEQQEQFERLIEKGLVRNQDPLVFVKDPSEIEHIAVVTCYHIDTLRGLIGFIKVIGASR